MTSIPKPPHCFQRRLLPASAFARARARRPSIPRRAAQLASPPHYYMIVVVRRPLFWRRHLYFLERPQSSPMGSALKAMRTRPFSRVMLHFTRVESSPSRGLLGHDVSSTLRALFRAFWLSASCMGEMLISPPRLAPSFFACAATTAAAARFARCRRRTRRRTSIIITAMPRRHTATTGGDSRDKILLSHCLLRHIARAFR